MRNKGRKLFCPYCGQRAEYVDSKVIYGKSYGMIYLCRRCDAYVGTHRGSDKPKGSLANSELRYWRKQAHAAFDPIWQIGRFCRRRNEAYAWLSKRLGTPVNKTHIGMFDVIQCKKVIDIMKEERSLTC